jgi:hypothetical protein
MTSSRFETEVVPGAIYRHYKGQLYRVIGVGKHSESLDDIVLYEALYDNPLGRLWCRPLSMWGELVNSNGEKVHRFEFLYK